MPPLEVADFLSTFEFRISTFRVTGGGAVWASRAHAVRHTMAMPPRVGMRRARANVTTKIYTPGSDSRDLRCSSHRQAPMFAGGDTRLKIEYPILSGK